MKHYLTQFRGFRIPGRKTLPVHFTERADERVAVLAADFAILVAVTSVEPWFAHAALPSSRPQSGRLSPRGGDCNRQCAATHYPCRPAGRQASFSGTCAPSEQKVTPASLRESR